MSLWGLGGRGEGVGRLRGGGWCGSSCRGEGGRLRGFWGGGGG